jgi:membrane-bound metal-dependent hydrolase YbcI (DUF457 family)
MSLPFMHLIFVWVIGLIYQKISKTKIKHYGWLALLLGALLPDIDYLPDFFLGTQIHRTFTHSILFLIIIVVVYLILKMFKIKEIKHYTLMLTIGLISHLILDMFYTPGIMLFWPLKNYYSYYGLNINITYLYVQEESRRLLIDIGLGLLWIFSLITFKKVKI